MLFTIVIIGLAYAVLLQIIKVRKSYRCPEEEALQDYFNTVLKKKDKNEYNRVITHLGICEKCRDRLTSFADDIPSDIEIEDHLMKTPKS